MAYNKQLKKLVIGSALAVLTVAVLPINVALAESDISSWRDDPLRLNVKFEGQSSAFSQQSLQSANLNLGWMSEFDNVALSPANTKYSLDRAIIRQYDATFFYPFQRGKLNFDLGLNIKFINGITEITNEFGVTRSQNYNATLPMMYATALYELPWKGLSAGIEGKHMVLDNSSAYDYKAMLSYQSRNGFGMNGGWQYQQLNLNAFQNITASSETEGPFVDFYFKF
ncbi:hypothetical protein MNBD_GAMMA23-1783 [hydrothermal vent metagenome]|uniref:Outer membrane protein beta-barrel domain-containing protein n=1 Tax=hydrothermal vent metagenome TaxID=652676 RepID=A0A3B1A9G2_9ZZZZ